MGERYSFMEINYMRGNIQVVVLDTETDKEYYINETAETFFNRIWGKKSDKECDTETTAMRKL